MVLLRRDAKILKELSLLSLSVKPEVRNWRICACLADTKGNILSYGFPRRKTHPSVKYYSENEDKIFIHAEFDCIIRGINKVDKAQRSDLSLYIHRSKMKKIQDSPLEYSWVNGMSKPCEVCTKLIEKLGLRKVLYSTDEQGYELL